MTAVADGLPGFRWCKRNEVVYTDLPEKMSLIIALIMRLIWEKKRKRKKQKMTVTSEEPYRIYLASYKINFLKISK